MGFRRGNHIGNDIDRIQSHVADNYSRTVRNYIRRRKKHNSDSGEYENLWEKKKKKKKQPNHLV